MVSKGSELDLLLRKIVYGDQPHLWDRYLAAVEKYKDTSLSELSKDYQEKIDLVMSTVSTLEDVGNVAKTLLNNRQVENEKGEAMFTAVGEAIQAAQLLDKELYDEVQLVLGKLPGVVKAQTLFTLGTNLITYANEYEGRNLTYNSEEGKIVEKEIEYG